MLEAMHSLIVTTLTSCRGFGGSHRIGRTGTPGQLTNMGPAARQKARLHRHLNNCYSREKACAPSSILLGKLPTHDMAPQVTKTKGFWTRAVSPQANTFKLASLTGTRVLVSRELSTL